MTGTTQERIAPIGLPAGQFELKDIEKALDSATSVKNREEHPERISKAIVETINNPELLIRGEMPAVPTGAELSDQEITYVEGAKPVTRPAVAFGGVDAKDGTAASEMRYEERGAEVVATDEAPGAPVDGEGGPATLGEQAAERIADEADTSTGKGGGNRK